LTEEVSPSSNRRRRQADRLPRHAHAGAGAASELRRRQNLAGAALHQAGWQKRQSVSIPTTYKFERYPALKLKEARDKARQFLDDLQKAKARRRAPR
jgi:hypothetical protein